MSDVIDFLEKMGGDGALRHASPDELMQALEQAALAEPMRHAILAGDSPALHAMLGKSPLIGIQTPAPGEEEEEEEGDEDGDAEETPRPDGMRRHAQPVSVLS